MNLWPNSFVIECPRDTDPAKADDHIAVEVRAPVEIGAIAKLSKAIKRCTCGAELEVRGQKIAGENDR